MYVIEAYGARGYWYACKRDEIMVLLKKISWHAKVTYSPCVAELSHEVKHNGNLIHMPVLISVALIAFAKLSSYFLTTML